MNKLFCGSKELDLSTPVVMGVLNVTNDSFFEGSRFPDAGSQQRQVEKMLYDGASVIDIGAVSTRPGAWDVSEGDEVMRLTTAIDTIRNNFPECIISADTFRPGVARAAVEHGAGMINDIYGGRFDKDMLMTVASMKVPYIVMHMKGTPADMQDNPTYNDVVAEVSYFFDLQLSRCREAGIGQVIIDPGFGFGKTLQDNFLLLSHLDRLTPPETPILVGFSRKSLITRTLNIRAVEALNGTTVLNTIALLKGASILRVHDVREAKEAVRLVSMLG